LQINERMAQTVPCARKRKECPTKAEQRNIRSRHTESTQTTLEVQASWETCSHSALATPTPRPVIGSEWIQHQGQPRDRTLMARERGSTGNSNDVLDVGKMANSLQKVQVTASLMNTSRGIKVYDGEAITQSLELKQGGRSGIGLLAQVHHSTQKGMAVYALEWCYQSYARALEGLQVQMLTWGVLVGVITCVGVCVCFRP